MNSLNVPKLRFPAFDGEWEENELGNITNWASGGTPPKDNPIFWDGDIPWISASSMRGIVYSDSELKISSEGLKKGSKLAKKGSLLILVRGSMLFNKIPIDIVLKDVSFNQDVKSIVVDYNYSSSEFILNWFTAFEPKILHMVTGTGIGAGKLDLPDLKALKISLPTLPEQQKIASFLSAVDEKIQQLARRKELVEQYKKGVMQQLFSGKLRFKDENGNEYPDWEEKKLGEVAQIVTGKTPSTSDATLWNGDVQFITPTDIKDGTKYQEKTERYVANNDKIKILPINSIIYTCIASIGKMSISKFPSITNQQINSLVVNKDNNFEYIYYWLLHITPYIKTTQSNTTLPIINKTDFSKFSIKIPSILEQQKIANFLSGIDGKIEQVKGELVKTQEFKKGLLQQLFV